MLFPNKFYGQNFLVNSGIIDKIIATAELSKDDTVLEAGPGQGALTEELIKRVGRVIAVEKDPKLFKFLQEKFKDAKNLELINDDILQITNHKLQITNKYKIVANIPYNITGQFFQKFLSPAPLSSRGHKSQRSGDDEIATSPPNELGAPRNDTEDDRGRPQMIVVMVQKEVGDKILGRDGRTLLTLAAELYGKAEKVCDVSPGSFNPPPKVTSMVVKLTLQPYLSSPTREAKYSGIQINKEMEQKVMRLARIGFLNKRKKLISNLSTGLKISKDELAEVFASCGLDQNVRAERLLKDDWLKLAEKIE